jgi:hypothetical protein
MGDGGFFQWEDKQFDAAILANLQPRAITFLSTIHSASVIYHEIFSMENRRKSERKKLRRLSQSVTA